MMTSFRINCESERRLHQLEVVYSYLGTSSKSSRSSFTVTRKIYEWWRGRAIIVRGAISPPL